MLLYEAYFRQICLYNSALSWFKLTAKSLEKGGFSASVGADKTDLSPFAISKVAFIKISRCAYESLKF